MRLKFSSSISTFRIESKPYKSIFFVICLLSYLAFAYGIFIAQNFIESYGGYGKVSAVIVFGMMAYGIAILVSSPIIFPLITFNLIRNLFFKEELICKHDKIILKRYGFEKYILRIIDIDSLCIQFSKNKMWYGGSSSYFLPNYSPVLEIYLNDKKKIKFFKSIREDEIDEVYDYLKLQLLERFNNEEGINISLIKKGYFLINKT
jgi:hypothetical protein